MEKGFSVPVRRPWEELMANVEDMLDEGIETVLPCGKKFPLADEKPIMR